MSTIAINGNSSAPKDGWNVSGRAAHVRSSRLWIDDKGKRIPIKYGHAPDLSSKFRNSFEGFVKMWSDNTCLQFQKVEVPKKDTNSWCNLKPAKRKEDRLVYVRETGGGSNAFGIQAEGPKCEPIEWMPPEYVDQNNFLFAGTIGLMEPFNQRDFGNQVFAFNFEAFEKLSDQSYLSIVFPCRGKAEPLPLPYDCMSVMVMNSDWKSREGNMPVIISFDPDQQYLIDYRYRGLIQASFFDMLSINMVYKCIGEWQSSCKASGQEVPKCKNFGYVNKDCKCRCPPAYAGKTCETKTGDFEPYPTQDGVAAIEIADAGSYNLGKLLTLKTVTTPGVYYELTYYTFVIILIRPKQSEWLPNVQAFVPFKEAGQLLVKEMDKFIEKIHKTDCDMGMRLLVGNGYFDKRRRLATECTSTLASNEPLESVRVIRGRKPNITLSLLNSLGIEFQNKEMTVETSKLVVVVEFYQPPRFATLQNGTSIGGGNGTKPIVTSGKTGAMTAAGGSPLVAVAAAGAGLALLLLFCLLFFFLKRRKKKKQEELGEEEEDEDSDSASDSNGES